MRFTPHRSSSYSDSDVDSLWSQDSEEEEFPVGPRDGDSEDDDEFIEVTYEDALGQEAGGEDATSDWSEDESFRLFTEQRSELLKDLEKSSLPTGVSGLHDQKKLNTATFTSSSPGDSFLNRSATGSMSMNIPLKTQTQQPSQLSFQRNTSTPLKTPGQNQRSTTPAATKSFPHVGSVTSDSGNRSFSNKGAISSPVNGSASASRYQTTVLDSDRSFGSEVNISPSLRRTSRIMNQMQVTADINKLDAMVNKWSISNIEKYADLVKDDEQTIQDKLDQLTDQFNLQIISTNENANNIVARRKKRVSDLINERIRYEEEIKEQKRREAEAEKERLRKQQEEQARIQRELEEARKKQEEERKKQEAIDVANAEARKEAEKKAAEEAKAKAAAEAAAAKAAAEEAAKSRQYTDWTKVDKEFAQRKAKIVEIKEKILAPVSADANLRKYCFQNKRHIKVKLGQLTDSRGQLQTILRELFDVFEQAKKFNHLTYLWLLNFFAKGVVAQAETETIVAVQSAVPLGTLATFCMAQFPELVDLLLARFVKKCPQVIGYSCNIDTEEGRIRMGYKRKNEKWEDDAVYSERVSGMCSVWTVITMTEQLKGTPFNHPYPFSNTWRFLARQLNKDPELVQNGDFAAVAAWWDIASERFVQVYGRQAIKALQLASGPWAMLKPDQRFPAALRLQLLGEEWRKKGKLSVVVKPMLP
ncbi:nucleoporin GLE1 [Sugiyamaella lignohabitans]|uniref:mRNA export factor GLE1 n=1 Tax=Sugiyamaella lignohabitans TaxID=796027 RepID=A0A167CU19_9ASCO|nr:nucleoporin GLE1 [Sugiyamaella lignohabitans]ANB12105.1 nucleoporin GLE1 [Sugiyamaella lignohabitans]